MFFIAPKENLLLQKLHFSYKNSTTRGKTRDLVKYIVDTALGLKIRYLILSTHCQELNLVRKNCNLTLS